MMRTLLYLAAFVILEVFTGEHRKTQAATCDVSQCSVIIYRDCPAADSCGSANGKSCAYLPGGRSEATGCGSNPCSPVVGNGNWQSICGGIDAIEVSGPCTAQLARQSGGTSPYSKIYQSGFHGIWRTYENGVHLGDNAASVRMQCVVPSSQISTFCHTDRFGITMNKNMSSFASVTLRDASCTATSNDTHITLSTSFSECGTTKNETSDHIVVSNEVRMLDASNGVIFRGNRTIIPFSCKYSRSGLGTSLSSFQAKVKSVVQAEESGFGNFTIDFTMAQNALFESYYTTFPVNVEVNDRMYFQLSLTTNNSDTALLIEKCYATPTADKNDATKYPLIDSRCGTDNTLQFHDGEIHHKKFSILAFKFVNDAPTVYLHCEVFLCYKTSKDSRCTSGCGTNKVPSSRKKRGIERREVQEGASKLYEMDYGPIKKTEKTSAVPAASSQSVSMTTIGMGTAVGVLGLLLVAFFVFKVHKFIQVKGLKTKAMHSGEKGIENKAAEIDSCA